MFLNPTLDRSVNDAFQSDRDNFGEKLTELLDEEDFHGSLYVLLALSYLSVYTFQHSCLLQICCARIHLTFLILWKEHTKKKHRVVQIFCLKTLICYSVFLQTNFDIVHKHREDIGMRRANASMNINAWASFSIFYFIKTFRLLLRPFMSSNGLNEVKQSVL